MHVGLTEEQELLRQTAVALAGKIGVESPAELASERSDAPAWQLLAEAGLLALRVPEAAGGMGATGVDVMIVAEALGGASAPVPYLGSAVLATELLSLAGAEGELLEALATGEQRVAVALSSSLAERGDAIAWDAAGAGTVLISDGDRVLAAPLHADATPAADLTRRLLRFDRAAAEPVGALDVEAAQRWDALALAALSTDAVGVMAAALDRAVAHVKERVQFGVPVGSFQAVQHLLADQHVTVEAARSAVAHAAWAVDELAPEDALLAARAAKAYCSAAAREVTEAAIQTHGGIGMTWECMAHVHLRRALLDRQTLGDEHAQLAAIADSRLGAAP